MRQITSAPFNELRSSSARIDVAWLIVRKDATRFAFTSSDIPFDWNGDTYSPTNGFTPSAIVSKANLSVDNMECQVLESASITDADLRAGVWDNAAVKVFWISRYNPEWGIVPLRGGILGEIVIKDGQWTTQLRSLFEQLQLPFGYFYSLQCMATLGDVRCKVKLTAPVWRPDTTYQNGVLTDAGVGDIVRPTTPNGFWYVANYTASYDPTKTPISQPGQGLSGNDDLDPNDDTQVAVGPAFDNLNQFQYQGQDVDIFGIEI
jgi:hypothetical protein